MIHEPERETFTYPEPENKLHYSINYVMVEKWICAIENVHISKLDSIEIRIYVCSVCTLHHMARYDVISILYQRVYRNKVA